MKFILFLSILLGTSAFAEEPVISGSSSSGSALMNIFQNVSGTYGLLFTGPTLQNPDGNLDGRGTNVHIRNYISFAYKLSSKVDAQISSEFRQYWRPVDPKNPNRSNFNPRDPYVGFNFKNLWEVGNFSLGGKLRYFVPITAHNKSNVGKTYDTGNGQINFGILPIWKFLDGDISISCLMESSVNLSENAPAVREDYSLKAKPQFVYRLAQKWSSKVEYTTGDIRHSTNGKWSKLNDKELGHRVYLGVTYAPVPSFNISPSLNWGRESFRLNRGGAELFANYYFL